VCNAEDQYVVYNCPEMVRGPPGGHPMRPGGHGGRKGRGPSDRS
jgi:hypothetical protein